MERSKGSREAVRLDGTTFEEITGLPDIDIVVIDDALDKHVEKSYIEPIIPDVNVDLEDISDIKEGKTIPVEIVDEAVIVRGPEVPESYPTDFDIELMSLEVDRKKTDNFKKPIDPPDYSAVPDTPAMAVSFTDEKSAATPHEEIEETVDDKGGAAASAVSAGSPALERSESDLLDEIITIVDEESISNMRGGRQAASDHLQEGGRRSNKDALSLDLDIKTNRISGIAEFGGKDDSDSGQREEMPDFDSLDDEFIILQSDLEGEASGDSSAGTPQPLDAVGAEPEVDLSGADYEERKKREKRVSEIVIDISGEEKKNFTVRDFKTIDLSEAERVAREDILLLTEEDLIEELEEIDLMPVEDEHEEQVDIKIISDDESFQKDIDAILKEMEEDISFQSDFAEKKKSGQEEAGETEMPPGATGEEDITPSAGEVPVSAIGQEFEAPTAQESGREESESAEAISRQELSEAVPEERVPEAGESSVISAPAIPPQAAVIEEEAYENPPEVEAVHEVELVGEMDRGGEIEVLPEEISGITTGKNVFIIDDQSIDKGESRIDEKIFEENELEKITAGMVEVVEGNSVLMPEAKIEEDKEKIASIMSGTAPAFEDLLIEFEDEYIFREEDIDFVDRVFISHEYYEYREKMGKTPGIKERGEITDAVEIFGLTDKEFESIERSVFTREYEGIDLKEIAGNVRVGYNEPAEDRELLKQYEYVVADPAGLDEEEKRSIEEDIESAGAIIFEENVEEIRARLGLIRSDRQKDTVSEVPDISDSVFILDDEKDIERFTATMPVEKQENLKRLLKYLDGLFEKLPEEVIRKFAESEYFNLYAQVLHDLER